MSFANELWDQFEEVQKRVSAGKDFTASLVDFVHKRSIIEREYAKKLQSLCKSTAVDTSSMNAAWLSVKEETENVSRKHAELGDFFAFQVEEPLQNFLKENKKPLLSLKDQGRKITKDMQAAEAKASSAKLAFELARKKQDETKEEYERAAFNNQQSPAVEKLSKKMRSDAKKSSLCDKKYSEAVDACRSLQDRFYDEEMPRILSDFQKMEESRLARLKLVLQAYVELQRSVSPEVLSACDKMTALVSAIDPSADLNEFINLKKSGDSHPDRCEYETYSPEQQKCVRLGGSSSGGGASAPVSSSPAVSSPNPVSTPAASQPVQRSAPTQVAKGISTCRGLFDYNTADPNELAFKQGDIITVLQKDPSGWWQGELNGKIGVFPSVDWVEEIGAGSAPPQSAPPAAVVESFPKCRALYDYNGDNQYELSIRAGDILTIEGNEEGWYSGKNQKGQFGRYPSNYVENI